MSEGTGKPRWFQFTIRRILGATFWMGLSLGLYSLSWAEAKIKEPIETNPPLFIAVVATMVLSPFVAVGTLFGHPWHGLAVGVTLFGGYTLALYIAIKNGWVQFP